MVDDGKGALCEARLDWTTLTAPQRLIQTLMRHFSHNLTGAESPEENQHGRGTGFEQLSETSGYRPKVYNTIECSEVGEHAIEKPSAGGEMTSREILQLFSSCDFSMCAKRGKFGPCLCNHRGRRVGHEHLVAIPCKKCGVFAGAPSQFHDMTAFWKFTQERLADGTTLCSHAAPCAEALVKGGRDGVEGLDSGPHC